MRDGEQQLEADARVIQVGGEELAELSDAVANRLRVHEKLGRHLLARAPVPQPAAQGAQQRFALGWPQPAQASQAPL